jgi:hypothetical protein
MYRRYSRRSPAPTQRTPEEHSHESLPEARAASFFGYLGGLSSSGVLLVLSASHVRCCLLPLDKKLNLLSLSRVQRAYSTRCFSNATMIFKAALVNFGVIPSVMS